MLTTQINCRNTNGTDLKRAVGFFCIFIFVLGMSNTGDIGILQIFSANPANAQSKNPPSLPMPASGDKYAIATKYEVGTVAPANLDGDGLLDWVIRRNLKYATDDDNIILEARNYSGDLLWEYDTGISKLGTIDHSGWHEAFIVWNMQEATAWDEVVLVAKRTVEVSTGNWQVRLYITMLDGKTGKEIVKKDYPSFQGSDSRRYAAIAYFGGKPNVVIAEGITHPGGVTVFDSNLNTV